MHNMELFCYFCLMERCLKNAVFLISHFVQKMWSRMSCKLEYLLTVNNAVFYRAQFEAPSNDYKKWTLPDYQKRWGFYFVLEKKSSLPQHVFCVNTAVPFHLRATLVSCSGRKIISLLLAVLANRRSTKVWLLCYRWILLEIPQKRCI